MASDSWPSSLVGRWVTDTTFRKVVVPDEMWGALKIQELVLVGRNRPFSFFNLNLHGFWQDDPIFKSWLKLILCSRHLLIPCFNGMLWRPTCLYFYAVVVRWDRHDSHGVLLALCCCVCWVVLTEHENFFENKVQVQVHRRDRRLFALFNHWWQRFTGLINMGIQLTDNSN